MRFLLALSSVLSREIKQVQVKQGRPYSSTKTAERTSVGLCALQSVSGRHAARRRIIISNFQEERGDPHKFIQLSIKGRISELLPDVPCCKRFYSFINDPAFYVINSNSPGRRFDRIPFGMITASQCCSVSISNITLQLLKTDSIRFR